MGPPKTGRPRWVALAPETTKIRHGDIWQEGGSIFTKDDGMPMHPDRLNKFSEANDLSHINPHAFRHTVASIPIANCIDPVATANEPGRADAAGVRAGVFSMLREA